MAHILGILYSEVAPLLREFSAMMKWSLSVLCNAVATSHVWMQNT